MGKVKAAFFDVGSTLLHDCPSVPYTFCDIAHELGYKASIEDVLSYMPEVNAYYEDQYAKDGDFWCSHERSRQIWLDMYTLLAYRVGLQQAAKEISEAVYEAYLSPDRWEVYPDVPAALEELVRNGVHLAVVSNWDATLESLLRKTKLLPYFDEVVASAVVGYRKPDPAIFEIALERMGVRPDEAVHVGDLPEADGVGASLVGIRPVIIDRKGRFEECPYDTIGAMDELPSIILEKTLA